MNATESSLPPLSDLFQRYRKELLLIILPGLISIVLAQVLHQKDLQLAYYVLLPFFIVAWIFKIGLMLHVVDRQLEPISGKELFSLGGSFWITMLRAVLLLIGASLLIIIPLLIIGNVANFRNMAIGQLIAALALVKWNLLLEPILYRDRSLVIPAWKAASKVRLSEMKNLVLLFVLAALLGTLPYGIIHPVAAIVTGFISTVLGLVIDLMALRFVCSNPLTPLDRIPLD